MITNLCTAALSNFLVCKTILFNRDYFIQGAFTIIQEPSWKNQGLFKNIQKGFPISRTFQGRDVFSRIIQGPCKRFATYTCYCLGVENFNSYDCRSNYCHLPPTAVHFPSVPIQLSLPLHLQYTYSESPFPQPNITVDKTNPNPKPQALHSYQLAGCTKEVLSKHNLSEP